jgi:ABC-2 type transport system permease protein
MRNVWTLARRELGVYFNSPLAYTVAFVILLVLGIFFGLNIAYFTLNATLVYGGSPDAGVVTGPFAFMLLLSVPALTMGLFADERRLGTMELLMTAPVRDWELVLGKWLGSFLFILMVIGVTLVFPLTANALVKPGIDWGQFAASYLGIILVAAAFLSLGTGISALFSNQIAAFFATLLSFVFLWWLIGVPAQVVPTGMGVFHYLDMSVHFYNAMNVGVIQLADIVYYLSLIALGFFMGTLALETWRQRA